MAFADDVVRLGSIKPHPRFVDAWKDRFDSLEKAKASLSPATTAAHLVMATTEPHSNPPCP